MKKLFFNWHFMTLTATVLLFPSTLAYAGEWKQQNDQTWYYDNGNGTILSDGWYWLDGNGDGISECYWFDKRGILLQTGITPDGYMVNSDGAWVIDYIVQTKVETQNIESMFSANEKVFWEDVLTAYYYEDCCFSPLFMMVFLSISPLGDYYTSDSHFYQVPKFTLQQLTKNIFGESIYTSDNYSWTNDSGGVMHENNGQVSFYAGDFGAEWPFAEIDSIKQIDTNFLKITGIVGYKTVSDITYYTTFNAWLEYIPNAGYPYSYFTLRKFVY